MGFMTGTLLSFVPFAALLVITPGPATAMVVHSAARGGRRYALVAASGNSAGLVAWALASLFGVSALVAASEAAYAALKVVGALVLIALGIQALRRARRGEAPAEPHVEARHRAAFRDGLVTSLSNPKVAVFYIALLPQFVPADAPVLPVTLLLAAIQIALAFSWHLILATLVGRAREAFSRAAVRRRIEAVTGTVLIGLGLRLAAERP
jgi:threonine/homoserine/homoserine lactone efflux protein